MGMYALGRCVVWWDNYKVKCFWLYIVEVRVLGGGQEFPKLNLSKCYYWGTAWVCFSVLFYCWARPGWTSKFMIKNMMLQGRVGDLHYIRLTSDWSRQHYHYILGVERFTTVWDVAIPVVLLFYPELSTGGASFAIVLCLSAPLLAQEMTLSRWKLPDQTNLEKSGRCQIFISHASLLAHLWTATRKGPSYPLSALLARPSTAQ